MKITKNKEVKEGWLNRHIDGLPKEGCLMEIIVNDYNKFQSLCTWTPFNRKEYDSINMPAKGYLGTCRDLKDRVGFHAWEQNDSEFVYYRLLNKKQKTKRMGLRGISNLFRIHWFTEKDLVSFGNYLLSDERKQNFHEKDSELLKQVNDVDIQNWQETKE